MHSDLDQLGAVDPSELYAAEQHAGQPKAPETPLLALRSDVCIVGAGVAGLILAQRLAQAGLQVHLLEAGGQEFEQRSQGFYDALMAGTLHTGTMEGRFRTFGGSSTRWGAQLLPFTSDIFAPPAGAPSLGWPVSESELTPHYRAVEQLMQVNLLPFTGELLPALGHRPVAFGQDLALRYSKWAPFGQRNLGHTVGKTVLGHPRARVWTHANAASLHPGEGSRIGYARVLNYAGQVFHFHADQFVVAAGTIESSRLLLSSPGVPNRHDQLGRYFHDHVSFGAATVDGPVRGQVLDRLGPFFVERTMHTCKLEASAAAREQAGLLAVMGHFVVQEPEDSGVAAIRNLLRSVQNGKLAEAVGSNLLPMVRGTSDVARMLWYARVKKRRAVSARAVVRLNIDLEQAARAENRIRLAEQRDALGLPRAIVDWRVGPEECATACRFAGLLKATLEQAGFSGLAWTPGLLDGHAPQMADTYHAMGGLRMGTDEARSVVDAQLQVHGVANLHVASCATYPGGGSSNPTFTLMALAMRLADRLAARGPGSQAG